MKLQVLLVEDNADDYAQLVRDLPGIFESQGYDVDIDPKSTFEEGLAAAKNPLTRYDMVISDTYRGEHENHDAAVLRMIQEYRSEKKFCPLIVISSGVCPADFQATPFVKWASKAPASELEDQIQAMLQTGIPQTARKLHDELDNQAGEFLWGFLEANWAELSTGAERDSDLIERIVRRRAAITLSDLIPSEYAALDRRYGLEYYVYPALKHGFYSLGDVLVDIESEEDYRVIATPHCHLFQQAGQKVPRAEHVLTIRTVPASKVLGKKINSVREAEEPEQDKKLLLWALITSTNRKEAGWSPLVPAKVPRNPASLLRFFAS